VIDNLAQDDNGIKTVSTQTYTLAPRSIPLVSKYEVIVIGGGPAGCTTAAAAARAGAKTLLVEQTGSLGGMGTSALVPAWTPFSDKKDMVYRGMAERVFNQTKAGMPHVRPTDMDWVPIDAERLKRVYDNLVTEFGVDVLFNTFMSSVEKEDGRVKAVLLSNKAGLSAYTAKVFCDTTGDADLAAWAGAEFHLADDSGDPNNFMPATHCFVLSNVDDYAFRTGPGMHAASPQSPHHKIVQSGRYPDVPDVHMCPSILGPGTMGFNAGHVYAVNSTDPVSVSKALMTGRKIAAAFRDGLAEFYPSAFANAHLVQTGSLLGVRESRRIVGDYVLTLEDYVARRSFDDEICRNSYFIDVHAKVREAFNDVKAAHKWEETTFRYGEGESHGIPYRCLVPKNLSNVLVAGRSISAEQIVQGSVRVMPCCLAMGEAAGIAAAAAAKMEVPDTRKVDVQKLRADLKAAGAYIK